MNTVEQYQGLCEELNVTPYAAMNEERMTHTIDEMVRVARKTPGSTYYMT